MLKMERGAAGAASRRNSRVVDMDELKKARERRASSARHPADTPIWEGRQQTSRATGRERVREQEEFRHPPEQMEDDRPFWEKDSPFAEGSKPNWQQGRPQGSKSEDWQAAPKRASAQEEVSVETRPARGRRSAVKGPELPDREQRPNDRKPPVKRVQQNPAGLRALLVLLALLALTVVIGLKVFEIQEIEVKGADTITPDSVIALSGLAKGENIFKTSLTQARKNLESDPLVEVLGISRIFPDKIKIEIRQRKPHAAVAWLDGYAIIDERGFTLDVRDSLPAGQYPLVTGVDIEPAHKGSPINGVDATKMAVLEKLLTALDSQGALQLVSEVNLADPGELKMLTAEGLQINMGAATDLEMKSKWIAGSVPELRKKGYTSGVLYVTGSKGPVYSEAAGVNQGGSEDQNQNGGSQTVGDDEEGQEGPENAV